MTSFAVQMKLKGHLKKLKMGNGCKAQAKRDRKKDDGPIAKSQLKVVNATKQWVICKTVN